MDAEQLKSVMRAQPFQPFSIHTTDSRTFFVKHPDLSARCPSGRTLIVYNDDESHSIINMLLVTGLDFHPPANSERTHNDAMNRRTGYNRALAVVREVIHAWDPYSLLKGGAPADEWEDEIARVVPLIPQIKSPDDAAHVLSRVFSAAFQPEGFGPSDCADVGHRLYAKLLSSGLIMRPAC